MVINTTSYFQKYQLNLHAILACYRQDVYAHFGSYNIFKTMESSKLNLQSADEAANWHDTQQHVLQQNEIPEFPFNTLLQRSGGRVPDCHQNDLTLLSSKEHFILQVVVKNDILLQNFQSFILFLHFSQDTPPLFCY